MRMHTHTFSSLFFDHFSEFYDGHFVRLDILQQLQRFVVAADAGFIVVVVATAVAVAADVACSAVWLT